jgi:hypothetical protein
MIEQGPDRKLVPSEEKSHTHDLPPTSRSTALFHEDFGHGGSSQDSEMPTHSDTVPEGKKPFTRELTERERNIVALASNFSNDELARIFNMSRGAIATKINRLRKITEVPPRGSNQLTEEQSADIIASEKQRQLLESERTENLKHDLLTRHQTGMTFNQIAGKYDISPAKACVDENRLLSGKDISLSHPFTGSKQEVEPEEEIIRADVEIEPILPIEEIRGDRNPFGDLERIHPTVVYSGSIAEIILQVKREEEISKDKDFPTSGVKPDIEPK